MHQGQDYFVHAAKGFGPKTGHVRPGIRWRKDYGDVYPNPKLDLGHRFDDDREAWKSAQKWTEKWFDAWKKQCGCQR
jgi:hypothetical protein